MNIGMNQQYAESPKCVSIKEQPPIQEMLSRLNSMVEDLHNSMTRLEVQLEPVRSPKPTGDGSDKPCASMPTQIETRLFNIQDGLERLHRRLEVTRDELRI